MMRMLRDVRRLFGRRTGCARYKCDMHLAQLALVVLDRVEPLVAVLALELAAAPVHLLCMCVSE